MCDIHFALGCSVVYVQCPVMMCDEEERGESSALWDGPCPPKMHLHLGFMMCSDLFVSLRLCFAVAMLGCSNVM